MHEEKQRILATIEDKLPPFMHEDTANSNHNRGKLTTFHARGYSEF